MKCTYCGLKIQENCNWNQGRCPHRSYLDSVLLDNYKARYYNLIKSVQQLFKGILGKWQQRNKNKN